MNTATTAARGDRQAARSRAPGHAGSSRTRHRAVHATLEAGSARRVEQAVSKTVTWSTMPPPKWQKPTGAEPPSSVASLAQQVQAVKNRYDRKRRNWMPTIRNQDHQVTQLLDRGADAAGDPAPSVQPRRSVHDRSGNAGAQGRRRPPKPDRGRRASVQRVENCFILAASADPGAGAHGIPPAHRLPQCWKPTGIWRKCNTSKWQHVVGNPRRSASATSAAGI